MIVKIIVGEYPIEKWEEVKKDWWKNGGEVITQKVNEDWQARKKNQ